MDRNTKEALIKEYNEIFTQAVSGVLVDYKGATVEQLTNLRKTLYEKNSRFRVLKNTLAKRAAQGTPFEGLADQFVQTRAFIYSDEEVAGGAKIICKEAKDNDNITLIGGVLVSDGKGEVLDEAGVKALSNLPGKEELLAKLLFLLNAPATNFVRVLNEIPSSFVRVVKAYADSKE